MDDQEIRQKISQEIRTGGCQCGGVRYRLAGPPLTFYACHCTECRRQSGAAFGLSMIFPRQALRLTRGAPKRWSRPVDSGGALQCWFCPECGCRLWHESAAPQADISIKAGILDAPPDVSGLRHIWVSRKLPGLELPASAEQNDQEPRA